MRMHRSIVPLLAVLALAAAPAHAQGKGRGKSEPATAATPAAASQAKGAKKVPPGQAKKITPDDAVTASRDVFQRNGYRVVRVETVGLTRGIYYRRGNNGNGKGQGPLMKMVVRPANDVVVIEGGTQTLADKIRAVLKI